MKSDNFGVVKVEKLILKDIIKLILASYKGQIVCDFLQTILLEVPVKRDLENDNLKFLLN